MADIIKKAKVSNIEKEILGRLKQESAKLVLEQKQPVSAAAREIGVHANALHKWVTQ